MNNDFIKLFNNFNSHIELGMSKDIQVFWEEREDIKSCEIQLDQTGKVLIIIKLYNYSRLYAKKIFLEFLDFIGYEDINLFLCENIGEKTRYLYLTSSLDFNGVKIEIEIQ